MVPRAPGQNPSTSATNDTPEALGASSGRCRLIRSAPVLSGSFANALLVLLALEVVAQVLVVAQMLVAGTPQGATPVQFMLFGAVYFLVRWLFVLPGLLLVLAGSNSSPAASRMHGS